MSTRTRLALALALGVTGGVLALPAGATPTPVTGRYVLSLGPGVATSTVARLVGPLGARAVKAYPSVGAVAVTLPNAAAPALRLLPGVRSVVANGAVRVDAPRRAVRTTQTNPPSYGLDRIDQRALPLSNSFTSTANGAGVTAYVIDTGINFGHTDFGGRAVKGVDAITAGGSARDCNGHGTHVAGTVGGARYGVAKAVKLVAVRVLDCNGEGTTESVVAGIDFVTANHAAGAPAVANLSLGGSVDAAIDNAVNRGIADGVSFVVSAGNEGGFFGELLGTTNACNHSPARVPGALTVAATDRNDNKASYSNTGTCVDLFAPGTDIVSNAHDSSTGTATLSGTSMSAPHVAGVVAQYLSKVGNQAPSTVASAIVNAATTGVVKSPGSGSPNRLLFTNY